MTFSAQSDEAGVTIDIDPPNGESPRELRVVVRRPAQTQPAKVTVNGEENQMDKETVVIRQPKRPLQITGSY